MAQPAKFPAEYNLPAYKVPELQTLQLPYPSAML